MQYGLIGKPLGHSYSPRIHNLLGTDNYDLFEVDDLNKFFSDGDFKGVNVTSPYKIAAMKYCDEVSNLARRIGCVNTIVKREDGTLYGDNTDYYGFSRMVKNGGVSVKGRQCLVLGSGGASKCACAALEDLGAGEIVRVSRKGPVNYDNVYDYADAGIIVNCTPVGTYPDVDGLLLNVTRFQRLMGIIDVVYNPARSELALQADRQQLPYVTGLKMLVYQAARSEELFQNKAIDEDDVEKVFRQIDFEKKNLLVIGMPGCGKTTIGKELSKILSRDFIDLDEEIEKKTNRTCADIISKDGEKAFRAIETEILKEFSLMSAKVISCGGGVISPKDNRYIMKKNSNVIWLQRDINELATEGRPISQIIGTHELYRYREPLYAESADYVFFNKGNPNDVANKIIKGILQ